MAPSFPKIEPIAGTERESRFPHAGTDVLMVAEVAEFKAEHARLNPGADSPVQGLEPVAKDVATVGSQVLPNQKHHWTHLSYHM